MSEQVQGGAPAEQVQSNQPEVAANEQQGDQVAELSEEAAAEEIAALEDKANLTKSEKKMLKELKIKFNGKEFTEKLPFEIPDDEDSREYMSKQLQMSRMAQAKAQEYATLRKQTDALIDELRKNPRKILSDPAIGVDLKKFAAEFIEEELKNAEKSPEQLEREALQRELEELKAQREKEKEEFRNKELERMTNEATERYDQQISAALSASDLPKSPYVVKKIADYMYMGIEAGYDISPADILPLVRDEIHNDIKEMFGAMPEDVIENMIGKDVFTKVRKKNIAKAKEKQAPAPLKSSVQDVGAKKVEAPKVAEKIPFKKFFGY